MSSIKTESQQLIAARRKELARHEEFGTRLLLLFNRDLVDFVRQEKNGTYTPVDWPKQATHQLIPTSWNNPKDYRPNKSGHRQMPDGFALSVCAVPLKRKTVMRGMMVKVSRRLPEPKARPAYLVAGELDGKKNVLRWMIEAMGAKVKKTYLKNAGHAQCDSLYRSLLDAHARA